MGIIRDAFYNRKFTTVEVRIRGGIQEDSGGGGPVHILMPGASVFLALAQVFF
jgi:hypothetical protein